MGCLNTLTELGCRKARRIILAGIQSLGELRAVFHQVESVIGCEYPMVKPGPTWSCSSRGDATEEGEGIKGHRGTIHDNECC